MNPNLIFVGTMAISAVGFGSLAWLCDWREAERREDAEREQRRMEQRIRELAALSNGRRPR